MTIYYDLKFIKMLLENDDFSIWCELNNIDKDTNLLHAFLSGKKSELNNNYCNYLKTLNKKYIEYNEKTYINIYEKLNEGYMLLNFSIRNTYFKVNNLYIIKEKDTVNITILKTKKSFSYIDKQYFKILYSFLYNYFGKIELKVIPISSNILNESTYLTYNLNSLDTIYSSEYFIGKYKFIENIKTLIPGENIFPNMKCKNDTYNTFKKNIANKIDEITQYYYCTYKNREYYLNNFKHKELNCKTLNINNKNTSIINKILKNRNKTNKQIIKKIKAPFDITKCVFIDFEYIPNIVYNCNNIENIEFINGIYNIGLYDSLDFKSYYTYNLNISENPMVMDFYFKLKEYSNLGYTIIHWTDAEIKALNIFEKKYNIDLELHSINFYDLHKLFTNNNLYINSMKSYKLKDICNALISTQNINLNDIEYMLSKKNNLQLYSQLDMSLNEYKHKDISTGIETIGLYLLYNNLNTMNIITKYNKLDCYYLSLLVNYFLE